MYTPTLMTTTPAAPLPTYGPPPPPSPPAAPPKLNASPKPTFRYHEDEEDDYADLFLPNGRTYDRESGNVNTAKRDGFFESKNSSATKGMTVSIHFFMMVYLIVKTI